MLKKRTKQFLCFLLSICLAATCLVFPASAEDTEYKITLKDVDYPSRVYVVNTTGSVLTSGLEIDSICLLLGFRIDNFDTDTLYPGSTKIDFNSKEFYIYYNDYFDFSYVIDVSVSIQKNIKGATVTLNDDHTVASVMLDGTDIKSSCDVHYEKNNNDVWENFGNSAPTSDEPGTYRAVVTAKDSSAYYGTAYSNEFVVKKTHFTVTFMDGETTLSTVSVSATGEEKVTKPDDPTRSGYRFIGWFEEGAQNAFDFDTPITDDITLYASFEEIPVYTVTFIDNNDTRLTRKAQRRFSRAR